MIRVNETHLPPVPSVDGTFQLFELLGLGGGIPYPHVSLAKTVLKDGAAVEPHFHRKSDEFYLFTAGTGDMRVGEQWFPVGPGELVWIQRNEWHELRITGSGDLEFYALSHPPYVAEDFLTEGSPS